MSEPMQDSSPENRTFTVVFAEQQARLHKLEAAVHAVCGNQKAFIRVDIVDWKHLLWKLETEYAGTHGFHLGGSDLADLIDQAFALLAPAMHQAVASMGERARSFSQAMGWDETTTAEKMNTPFVVALCTPKADGQ